MTEFKSGMSRRDLLAMIGTVAGSVAMYNAMTTLGFAQESTYDGPVKLEGDPKGASVLVLGAGLAGMTGGSTASSSTRRRSRRARRRTGSRRGT